MSRISSFSRPTYAEISSENLVHNYRYLKSSSSHDFFCPMVKADAYGHDYSKIVPILERENCGYLGVATIEEAIAVRNTGYSGCILVFSPEYKNSKEVLKKYSITPVISDLRHILDLSDLEVHLKINTGMNRMGILPEEIDSALATIKSQRLKVVGVLSHFYEAANINDVDSSAQKQLVNFQKLVQAYFQDISIQHIYNSDSLLLHENRCAMGARPGIALYGYSTLVDQNLKPVLRLVAKIIKLHVLKAGEVVSYGATWTANTDSVIAVLAIGYADGIFRNLSNQCKFVCHDQEVEQVGTICMDYLMVDVTKVKDVVGIHDPIYLYGYSKKQIMDISEKLKTIPYEILTNISGRVPRVVVERFT